MVSLFPIRTGLFDDFSLKCSKIIHIQSSEFGFEPNFT